MREDAQNLLIMNKKNYRTLDGLYKALQKRIGTYAYHYTIQKNEDDVVIYCDENPSACISGLLIYDLVPVLDRSVWMVDYNRLQDRIEILAWLIDDNK